MTFQQIIETLNKFWAKHGCVIAQPYGIEVGAGTANPHTFFRVLGPEPYSVAYVEPSRRPTDGRYGKNPNRLQHYYQYQVVLKPAPKFNQELYIESLRELGIKPEDHDIRFVEDNWESTPLGAWGLGWEVWLDGMEVSQYTYFQQVAGIPLEVPALEITYGLERLAMYIQNVNDYRELKWNDKVTYGDIFEKHEFWQATHNYETASIESLTNLFNIYDKEAQEHLEKNNYWSAYDYILKLSHTFNLLDARGVVSVSDRVAKFAQMAKYSKQVGKLYLAEREEMGYPMLSKDNIISYELPTEKVTTTKKVENTAIVEIGFEEIPATYLQEWTDIIGKEWLNNQLQIQRLTYKNADLLITPRRIVIQVENPQESVTFSETITGPIWNKAFNGTEPTPMLAGFFSKHGIDASKLQKLQKGDLEVVSFEKQVTITLEQILQNVVDAIIESAPRTKWMKWDTKSEPFIRPLRWILALHNDKKLMINAPGTTVTSSNVTYTPRFTDAKEITIESVSEYMQFLEDYSIVLDHNERLNIIGGEEKKKFETYSPKYEEYVQQNAFLTEAPALRTVELPEKYMELPSELITYILEKNQMYLMGFSGNKVFYTIVANQKQATDLIEEGNAKVAKARLEDGLFYMNLDKDLSLKDLRKKLGSLNFHPKIGSYYDKVQRIAALTKKLLSTVNDSEVATLVEAALPYIKNDRASNLAKEFPKLEGIIGYNYALRDGLDKNIALLVRDYLNPTTDISGETGLTSLHKAALILNIADIIDSLVELSKVEPLPTGSHDPFEMRGLSYQLIASVLTLNMAIDLANYEISNDMQQFIQVRFEQIALNELKLSPFIASGTAFSKTSNFVQKREVASMVASISEHDQAVLFDSLKRVKNILSKQTTANENINEALLETESEKQLAAFVSKMEQSTNYVQLFTELTHILEKFFTETMVMVDNTELKNNRIALLHTLYTKLEQLFVLKFE